MENKDNEPKDECPAKSNDKIPDNSVEAGAFWGVLFTTIGLAILGFLWGFFFK